MKLKIRQQLWVPGALLTSILMFSSCTKNWPQFEKIGNDLVIKGINLPEKWGNDTNVAWTYDLNGTGWSSPVIWGDKIFISSAIPEYKSSGITQEEEEGDEEREGPPPPPPGTPMPGMGQMPPAGPPPMPPVDTNYKHDIYRWEVTCIDLKTGKEIWKQVAFKGSPKTGTHAGNGYASETPVTDGERVYVYFGMTGLFCYDMDGNLIWNKDMGAYQTQNNWGTGSSPVLYKEVLYLQIDNEENSFLVALDAKTGEEKWRVGREEKTNYSTPVIWKNKVRTELVTGGNKARSYDLATGKLLWELKLGGGSIPSPVGDNENLYIGNPGGGPVGGTLFSVKAGAEGDITPPAGSLVSNWVVWADTSVTLGKTSPVLYKGLLYISSDGGDFSCYNAETGKNIYRQKIENIRDCYASPWVYKDKYYFTDERGVTRAVKTGEQFEILSQNKISDKFWASAAIVNNTYVFKGAKKLYCVKD
jgi:outer membrane protein assembly factor BamB